MFLILLKEEHQKHALEQLGVTEEQFWDAVHGEAEIKRKASTEITVAMLKRSNNPKLPKFAKQYEIGLITWAELEMKVRETLGETE